jgi:protein-S-isoprenylcysteine O-methyltransferase Ste14
VTKRSGRDEPDVAGAAWTWPEMGPRGEGWVALQLVLIAALATAGIRGRRWPSSTRSLRLLAAGPAALTGAYLLAAGIGGLGKQLTPFPKPVQQANLRRDGAYGLVRHPMYGGVLLLASAWSLVSSPAALAPWAVAALFLDAKRRREESWLSEEQPEYEAYRQEVRHSFVPFVW